MLPYSVTLILYHFFLFYFVPYVSTTANRNRLGLSVDQISQLEAYWGTWQTDFGNYMNPLTYGTVNTGTINDLYAIVMPYVTAIRQQIKTNPTVTLTALDYVILAIHKDLVRRGKMPKPKQKVGLAVKGNTHLNTEFIVFDLDAPTRVAKPKDVLRITPYMLLLPKGSPIPTFDQLIQMEGVTRMTFDVPFTSAQKDMDGYMAVCFTNNAGSSEPSAIIPFSVI